MPMGESPTAAKFLAQADGWLSEPARAEEFAALTDAEAEQIEGLYARAFDKGPGSSA